MTHPLEALRQFAPFIGAALLLLGCLPTLAIGLTVVGLFRRVSRHLMTGMKRLEATPDAGQISDHKLDRKYQYGLIRLDAAGYYTRGGQVIKCRQCDQPIARNAFARAGLQMPSEASLRYAPFCANCTGQQNTD